MVTDLAAQLQSYHSGVADGLIKGLRLEIEVEAPLEATVEAQAEAESTDWTPRAILEVAKKVDIGEVIKKVRGKMIERQEALKKWDKAYKGLKGKCRGDGGIWVGNVKRFFKELILDSISF